MPIRHAIGGPHGLPNSAGCPEVIDCRHEPCWTTRVFAGFSRPAADDGGMWRRRFDGWFGITGGLRWARGSL